MMGTTCEGAFYMRTGTAGKRDLIATIIGHVATGVTAGAPGSFTGGTPTDLADLQSQGSLGESTAWDTDDYVVLQDGSNAYWDGDSWEAGIAP
jgi:hypothetical protein